MKKKLGITVLITALIIPSMTWASEETAAPTDVATTEEQENPETLAPTDSVTTESTETTDSEETTAPATAEISTAKDESATEEKTSIEVSTSPVIVAKTNTEVPRQAEKTSPPEPKTEKQVEAPPTKTVEDPVVTIPDNSLHSYITNALGLKRGTAVTRSMMATLTTLTVTSIYDTTGLEYAVNLRQFKSAYGFKGDNLTRILQLHHLETLELGPGPGPGPGANMPYPSFASLTELRELTVKNDSRMPDLNFLAENTALEKLDLGDRFEENDSLTDISALRHLTRLKSLSLYHTNQPLDYSPILTLSNLESLRIQNQGLQDASFLAPLAHLTHLDLTNNWFMTTDSINALPALQNVIWDGNFIPGQPNQYAAQLPTETTELAIGERTILPMTWTYNGVPLETDSYGDLLVDKYFNVPFAKQRNTVTSSPAILTSTKPTQTSIPIEATKGGMTTLTSEVIPGYQVQTKVHVLDIPKPPTLTPVSELQDTLHGKTSPHYHVQVAIDGKTYQVVADDTGAFDVTIGMYPVGTPYVVTISDPTGTEGVPVHAAIVDGIPPQLNPVTTGLQAISGRVIDGRTRVRVLVNGIVQREVDTDAQGYYTVPARKLVTSYGLSNRPIRGGDKIQVDFGPNTAEHLITRQIVQDASRPTTLDPVQARTDYITGQTLPGSQTLRLIVNGVPQRVITPQSSGAGQIEQDGHFKIYSRFNLNSKGQLARLQTADTITVDSGEQIYHGSFAETNVE
ncbi:leucine-rich repeat domain-containing protein [Listeria rustica]|uniref:Leucine-rich repeat domain-containing protein n=1 Tax=Listeria rustica TaxID=2713503 RepID=A0A7W1T4X5_9LIST|nr:hypothetical protein [Listeria rustica]MBA3925452.1 hypothetical protein [Listeria rustica]